MDAREILDALPFNLNRRTMGSYQNIRASTPSLNFTKKLKRMPHLFTRVLELPFHAEAPVRVVESRDNYRFEVRLPGVNFDDVTVEVLEIVPGATKVLVRGIEDCSLDLDITEVDLWRFRLPSTTVPEKSTASYDHEMLTITIPKVVISCNDDLDNKDNCGGDSDLVLQESFNDGKHSNSYGNKNILHEMSDIDGDIETEEERLQREVLEDLESFGSPKRAWFAARTSFSTGSEKDYDLKSSNANCTQTISQQITGSQEFFRSVGLWVGGFPVYVQ